MNNIDPDTFYQQMEEQVERRKRWGMVSQEQAMVMQQQADSGTPTSADAQAAEGNPQSTGEFMGLSRLQWNRNRKAIMDVLQDFADGKINRSVATVFFSGIGLSPDNIAMLLDDASDGSVDTPLPEDDSEPSESEVLANG